MKSATCPNCKQDLYGRPLKFVNVYWIAMRDDLTGQGLGVERSVYECPFCQHLITIKDGHIVSALPEKDG